MCQALICKIEPDLRLAQMWHAHLTQDQSNNIEIIQKRALRIICPGKDYNEALIESKLIPLKERRKHLCIDLVRNMVQPTHKLHGLLPDKHSNIKKRETRANSNIIYNFTWNVLRVVLWYMRSINTMNALTE